MATARLSDSQKQELVRRFRQGESTQVLADDYGCSTTTVTRLVRAELSPEDYAALREQRQRKPGRDRQIPLAIEGDAEVAASAEQPAGEPIPMAQDPDPDPAAHAGDLDEDDQDEEEDEVEEQPHALDQEPVEEPHALADSLNPSPGSGKVLAIDDAEDFTEDADSEEDLLLLEGEGDGEGFLDSEAFHPVAVLPIAIDDQHETRPSPWTPDVLPTCAYLLVDKTVELQALPLASIPELGRLPTEEQNLQALVLFTNPRQAKRQCGRTQRVIKVPDPALLGRTAPYLRAQGISRIVIEGALYALPGGG
jgi:hypothetical protein